MFLMEMVNVKTEDLKKLIRDVEQIKQMLLDKRKGIDEEGELSDWAKTELEDARKRKTKIPHEEVRRIILGK